MRTDWKITMNTTYSLARVMVHGYKNSLISFSISAGQSVWLWTKNIIKTCGLRTRNRKIPCLGLILRKSFMKFHHLCVIFRITNIISNRLDMSKIQKNVSMIINHQNPTSDVTPKGIHCVHILSQMCPQTQNLCLVFCPWFCLIVW